jgi:hypothetical protein
VITKTMRRSTYVSVVLRIILAAAIPTGAFWLKATPMRSEYDLGVLHYVAATLDLPVSGMNWLLPESFRTHLSMYRPCTHTYSFPAEPTVETFRYARAGFAPYLAILFVPGLMAKATARFRRRRIG